MTRIMSLLHANTYTHPQIDVLEDFSPEISRSEIDVSNSGSPLHLGCSGQRHPGYQAANVSLRVVAFPCTRWRSFNYVAYDVPVTCMWRFSCGSLSHRAH